MKRKREIILFLSTICFLLNICMIKANATTLSENGFTYEELNSEEVQIVKYTGGDYDLVIPEKLGSKKVVKIGDLAFNENTTIRTVVIPKGVTTIGDSAFSWCINLSNVEIPDSVQTIKANAFKGCSILKSIKVPEGITKIDNFTFGGCKELSEVILPSTVTSIGDYAFMMCSKINNITMSNKMDSISSRAFASASFKNLNIIGALTKSDLSNYLIRLSSAGINTSILNVKFIADEDIDGNGIFDIADISLIAEGYNLIVDESGKIKKIDVNRDLLIDIFDLVKVNKLL